MRNALPPRALVGISAAILALPADMRDEALGETQSRIADGRVSGARGLAVLVHPRNVVRSRELTAIDNVPIADSGLQHKLFRQHGPSPEFQRRQDVLVRAVRRGTLFLEGIDDISPQMQMRLSGVLEAEAASSQGSEDDWHPFDVRIVVCGGPDEADRVRAQREGLCYRLNVIHLSAPLREPSADWPAHLRDCLEAYAGQLSGGPREWASSALEQLKADCRAGRDDRVERVARLLVERSQTMTTDLVPGL